MLRSPLALMIAAGSLSISSLASPAGAQSVSFRSGEAKFGTLKTADQRVAAFQAAAGKGRHLLVQFNGPVSDRDRAALAAAGVTLGDYLSGFAFFASVDLAKLNTAALASVPSVVAVQPIQRDWKLHPMIVANDWPSYALTGPKGNQTAAVYVQFHKDAPVGLAGRKAVEQHGALVRNELQSIPVLVVEIPLEQVAALADEDSVMWIEPAMPPMEPLSIGEVCEVANAISLGVTAFNDSNRARTEAAIVQASPYNLDGTGVNVFVFDGGSARTTHQTFTAGGTQPSRAVNMDGAAVASHSTHVAGTIGGSGHGEAGQVHKGMAPGVRILSAGLNISTCGNPPYFLYDCLTDLESDYNSAVNHATLPMAIANNSIGTNTSTNGFPCSLQGDYGITDALIDSIVRGSLGRPIRVVWANGNERQSTACAGTNGGYYLTAPPATAKNHITVGALNSNNDSMTSFSSWGPTDDGRMKPDVSAPGCQSDGDNTVTSSTSASDTSYGASCGTSMASPTVCGVSALLLQDFRATFGGQPDPRNSTLKLLLAHTAQDLFNTGPDYQSGYGSVRIQRAIDFMRTGAFIELSASQGQTVTRNITVAAGQPLKVMLAWDDPAGTPNTTGASALVNDLDLRLVDPNNVVYLPWTLNPATPSAVAVRSAVNRRDNIEQVLVDNPIAGTWRIEVVGFNVPSGPQVFSLTGVEPGSLTGLGVTPITALPTLMAPGSSMNIDVNIVPSNQTLVAGSALMHYRTTVAGPFTTQPLTLVSGNTYRATLNAPPCNQTLQYYFSATGSVTGVATNPQNAPTSVYSTSSGTITTRFSDNFQTDQGWTVTNTPIAGGTFAGAWERGVPFSPATAGAPTVDGDGSGQCFVTGNNNVLTGDVDFGFTTVTSPIIDASGGGATVSYRRWFHRVSSTANGDVFRVETSSDGGTNWTTLELLGSAAGAITGTWQFATFPIATPTSQFRIRFTVNDNSTNSTSVEGAIDGVTVTSLTCVDPPSCVADWDGNTQIQPADVAAFVNAWSNDLNNGTFVTDIDNSGTVTPGDVALFVQLWSDALANGC